MVNNKKGFTIVELIIVIAVIAILAAAIVPNFSNVIRKAYKSKETQIAKNLNIAVAVENAQGNVYSLTDALYAMALEGYDLSEIAEDNGYQFMWDTENKKVLVVDEEYNVLNLEGYDSSNHEEWLSMNFEEEPLTNNTINYFDLFN